MNTDELQKNIEVITKNLTPLFSKIGQTGMWVYGLALRQVYVDLFTNLFFMLLSLACIPVIISLYKKSKTLEDYDSSEILYWVGIIILSLIAICVFCGTSISIINDAINPQYQAILQLTTMLKGLSQ